VIVEIGANTTNIIVVTDGVPGFVRVIAGGSDDITRAISSRMQWSPAEAENAKRAMGMGGAMSRQEDRPVLEIIYEAVGELLAGVRNTLSYYATLKPMAPVSRILLTGGGARLAGLPNALADLTGLPVGLADPLVNVNQGRGARTDSDAALTTAVGLALGDHS
jgi:type IV pilus assembly protein PilM